MNKYLTYIYTILWLHLLSTLAWSDHMSLSYPMQSNFWSSETLVNTLISQFSDCVHTTTDSKWDLLLLLRVFLTYMLVFCVKTGNFGFKILNKKHSNHSISCIQLLTIHLPSLWDAGQWQTHKHNTPLQFCLSCNGMYTSEVFALMMTLESLQHEEDTELILHILSLGNLLYTVSFS